jgi:hypothetical protein
MRDRLFEPKDNQKLFDTMGQNPYSEISPPLTRYSPEPLQYNSFEERDHFG